MGDIHAIVAIGKKGEIGRNGDLIWKIPDDLKHCKALTMGHPVIMGRKTWESLPKKPLPGRRNIVLTRKNDFNPEGAERVSSIEEALKTTSDDEPFIIGGAEIYKAFMPYVKVWHLTQIEDTCDDADAILTLRLQDWNSTEESQQLSTPSGVDYKFVTYKR